MVLFTLKKCGGVMYLERLALERPGDFVGLESLAKAEHISGSVARYPSIRKADESGMERKGKTRLVLPTSEQFPIYEFQFNNEDQGK